MQGRSELELTPVEVMACTMQVLAAGNKFVSLKQAAITKQQPTAELVVSFARLHQNLNAAPSPIDGKNWVLARQALDKLVQEWLKTPTDYITKCHAATIGKIIKTQTNLNLLVSWAALYYLNKDKVAQEPATPAKPKPQPRNSRVSEARAEQEPADRVMEALRQESQNQDKKVQAEMFAKWFMPAEAYIGDESSLRGEWLFSPGSAKKLLDPLAVVIVQVERFSYSSAKLWPGGNKINGANEVYCMWVRDHENRLYIFDTSAIPPSLARRFSVRDSNVLVGSNFFLLKSFGYHQSVISQGERTTLLMVNQLEALEPRDIGSENYYFWLRLKYRALLKTTEDKTNIALLDFLGLNESAIPLVETYQSCLDGGYAPYDTSTTTKLRNKLLGMKVLQPEEFERAKVLGCLTFLEKLFDLEQKIERRKVGNLLDI